MDEPARGGNFIARKLDRCLQNEYCMNMFPNALTEVQSPGLSDHFHLVTNLNVSLAPMRKKNIPFKFFNFWADHPAFLGTVKEAWDRGVQGTPMYRLSQKETRAGCSLGHPAYRLHTEGSNYQYYGWGYWRWDFSAWYL